MEELEETQTNVTFSSEKIPKFFLFELVLSWADCFQFVFFVNLFKFLQFLHFSHTSIQQKWGKNKTDIIYGQIALKAAGDSNVLNFIESKLKRMVKNVAIVQPI